MALQGIMTRGEIVTEALQWGGHPGLTTRVNSFLNLFLDHLYRAHDWEFLLTEASISSGSPVYTATAPALYGRVKAIHLDGEAAPLKQIAFEDLWQQVRSDNSNNLTSSGKPTHFAIDPAGPTFWFWPVPNKSFSGKLLYYKIPAKLTSDGEYPLFPDSLSLVEACVTFIESYEKESLQVIIDRTASETIRRYANNHFDKGRAASNNITLDPNIFGGWRYRET